MIVYALPNRCWWCIEDARQSLEPEPAEQSAKPLKDWDVVDVDFAFTGINELIGLSATVASAKKNKEKKNVLCRRGTDEIHLLIGCELFARRYKA